MADYSKYQESQFKGEIKKAVLACEALRKDSKNPQDISFAKYIKTRWGVSLESFYESIGIDPSVDTIENLFVTPDEDFNWLVPEIVRDALRLGLRKAPVYPGMIAAEQSVGSLTVTMPHIEMSDAMPQNVGEGETIPLGNISYGEKSFKLSKLGRGIKIPYEVRQYVSLDVIGIFLQDFGVKLGQGLDAKMIDVLINGEQTSGSESAAVVGVDNTTNGLVYADLLTVWVRLARIGKLPRAMVAGETVAKIILNMSEFKDRSSGTTEKNLNLKTPVPQGSDLYIHGAVPADQVIVVDPSSCIIKYNAQPLLVESEKIVSNQTEATYATLTTGFAVVFRDSRIIIDQSILFSGNGFPAYMDIDALEQVTFGS